MDNHIVSINKLKTIKFKLNWKKMWLVKFKIFKNKLKDLW